MTKPVVNLFAKATGGHPYVLAMVLRCFGFPKAKKLSMMNTMKKGVDNHVRWGNFTYYFPISADCFMEYFRYFKNDDKYIRKVLMTMDDQKQMTLISKIFSHSEAFRLRQYLMYELEIKIHDFINITNLQV